MSKSQRPSGVSHKEKCNKCGLLFFPIVLLGGKLTKNCQSCDPEAYLPQKKN